MQRERYPLGYDEATGFTGFVHTIAKAAEMQPQRVLKLGNSISGGLDAHFLPQFSQCGMIDGMRYDFFLKVEQMHEWYESFIDLVLGAKFEAQNFKGNGECFYKIPSFKCSDMFTQRTLLELNTSHVHGEDRDLHNTHSNMRLSEYYTPSVAREVNTFSFGDFLLFHYKQWNGVNGETYLKECGSI